MRKPYSDDLRERVIEAVEAGASRREAAESFRLSASSAVKWLQRWRDTGSARAKPSGGSTSPLEENAEWLLALVAEQPDLTLNEIVAAMRKRRIPGSRTAVWRFFERHNITVKKSLRGTRPFEMTPFMQYLFSRLDDLRPLLRNRVEMRVALHKHPGVAGNLACQDLSRNPAVIPFRSSSEFADWVLIGWSRFICVVREPLPSSGKAG